MQPELATIIVILCYVRGSDGDGDDDGMAMTMAMGTGVYSN